MEKVPWYRKARLPPGVKPRTGDIPEDWKGFQKSDRPTCTVNIRIQVHEHHSTAVEAGQNVTFDVPLREILDDPEMQEDVLRRLTVYLRRQFVACTKSLRTYGMITERDGK